MAIINLKNIKVSYDGKTDILKDLNLDIEKGQLISLLGPSGCGKTTTLRVIAGFIEPTGGQFVFNEKDYTKIPVHKRNFGLVFQSYALFPHLTVFDNVAFGLKMKKVNKAEINEKVNKILEVVDLGDYKNRYPKELSGGQRQRVAIARALVIKPDLLLLDEPLSNLDAKLRLKMRIEIRKLQQQLGITTVFVTHDQEECFSISDKVAVMNKGVIEQYDTPENIYNYPSTEFVARFVGFENFIDVEAVEENVYMSNAGVKFECDYENKLNSKKIKGTIRPDDIEILKEDKNTNVINGIVGIRTYLGDKYQYTVETDLGILVVNESSDVKYKQGDKVNLYLPSNKIILV
ncbi:ABC transporter ATP-binding protein [Clostridium ganghwense]|uniref:ABC transporter ATP-binding protein n=1 Tax=Clostridium ganghwense TaxID=312089 RepID=A0ABT4CN92_9CLOT|nr:ABC transporter ATP-binding protein [Clostridium ganghwense]MCY6369464.1 ABC transporter ATP-binding protein [Clostridium ganghwense]